MTVTRRCGKMKYLREDEEKTVWAKCSVMVDVWHKDEKGFAFVSHDEGLLHGCYPRPREAEAMLK